MPVWGLQEWALPERRAHRRMGHRPVALPFVVSQALSWPVQVQGRMVPLALAPQVMGPRQTDRRRVEQPAAKALSGEQVLRRAAGPPQPEQKDRQQPAGLRQPALVTRELPVVAMQPAEQRMDPRRRDVMEPRQREERESRARPVQRHPRAKAPPQSV